MARPSLLTLRGNYGFAAFQGALIVVGGYNGASEVALSSSEVLSPIAGLWVSGPPLIRSRYGPGLAEWNSSLYAVGGADTSIFLSSVEVLDGLAAGWRAGPQLSVERHYTWAAVFDSRLFVVGGILSGVPLSSVEVLVLGASSWVAGPALLTRRNGHGLAVAFGNLYAVGGANGTSGAPALSSVVQQRLQSGHSRY